MNDVRSLLPAVREIAEGAARVVLQHYAAGVATTEKADRSPVTAADHASSDYICERLAALDPGVEVISEEGAGGAGAVAAARFWLVDPLDGTKEFLKRTGEFTINIALVEGGRPILGVVHVPVSGSSYFAATGAGAFRAGRGEDPAPIATRRAAPPRLAIVASRDHAGPAVTELLGRLPQATTLSMGSSLKFCLVAEGRADLYLRDVPTMEWDTAAAHCVVEAAGGRLLTLDDAPLGYGKPGLRNPAIITVGDPSLPWTTYLK
ncbi:MAG TPA: 3'(2'),5'-bisphosphate nucleotidase CysQ [Longimicrobiales bacterium]|nr:3'(2'),5'-bisphosphate nucleotidase CysQ [Longimicrobiales bacterium]